MAVEQKRGCGFRRVGAMYLCGGYISASCDRLPLPLTTCPTCGGGIRVSRAFTEINPYRLWGNHDGEGAILAYERIPGEDYVKEGVVCQDIIRPCHVCDPPDDVAFIMMVGEKYYTPESFLEEAESMGISKRIPWLPKKLELGKTIIYLAHPRAGEVKVPAAMQQTMAIVGESETEQPRLLEAERNEKKLGIFCAFIPKKVEKLVWQSEYAEENIEKHRKRGIELIPVPDGDKDHGS